IPSAFSSWVRCCLMCGGLAGESVIVDLDEFAESEPVVLGYRLDTPNVLCGGFTLDTLGWSERRVRVLALQSVIGVTDFEQLAADFGEAQRGVSVVDRHER